MQPIVTERVGWSVCRPVTITSSAKTAEPIEMPFGVWTRVGPRNHVFDVAQITHANGDLAGKRAAQCKL